MSLSPGEQSALGQSVGAPVLERDSDIPQDWWDDFEAATRRPLAVHIRNSFIHTYKPVLDDARFRAFDTTEDYRRWCEESLPEWLGYARV